MTQDSKKRAGVARNVTPGSEQATIKHQRARRRRQRAGWTGAERVGAVYESLRPDGAVNGVAGGAEASLVPHGLLLLLGLCHLSLHLVIAVAVPSACRCTVRKGRAGRTYSSSWPLSWPSSLLLLVFVKFGLMIGLEYLHLRRSKRCRGGLSRHMGDPPSTRTPPKTSQMMKRNRGNLAIRGAITFRKQRTFRRGSRGRHLRSCGA